MIKNSVLEDYLLAKKGTVKEFPFGPDVSVFKVMNKMFALMTKDEDFFRINLKCNPQDALSMREVFPSVLPGYHMHKKHWNTIILDGTVPDDVIFQMIDDSYTLVVKGLTKAARTSLEKAE